MLLVAGAMLVLISLAHCVQELLRVAGDGGVVDGISTNGTIFALLLDKEEMS